ANTIYQAASKVGGFAASRQLHEHAALSRTLSLGHMISLTPAQADAPHSSLVHMLASLGRKISTHRSIFTGQVTETGSWMIDFDGTIKAIESASSRQEPLFLCGTAFSFVHLLDF